MAVRPLESGVAEPQDSENSPVFVVGCPRSGTTLLSVMLDRHSHIAMTPETAFYDEIDPFISQPMTGLRRVLADWPRLAELGLDLESLMERCGPAPERAGVLRALLELYARNRHKPRSGEKTPQHLRHVPTILADFPDARVLCLLRDGRDVVLSLRSMPWWPDSLGPGVDTWLEAVRLSEIFAVHYPGSFRIVRYEQLVEHPERTLAGVMTFLNLKFQSGQLQPGPSDVVLPRSMPWKGLALERIDTSRAERLRKNAGPAELEYLQEVLGSALRRLGYLSQKTGVVDCATRTVPGGSIVTE